MTLDEVDKVSKKIYAEFYSTHAVLKYDSVELEFGNADLSQKKTTKETSISEWVVYSMYIGGGIARFIWEIITPQNEPE